MFSELPLHVYGKLLTGGTGNLGGRLVGAYSTSMQCRQSGWQKISQYAEHVSELMAILCIYN